MRIWGLFDGRTFQFIRTHPKELNPSEDQRSKYDFVTFSEKAVGNHEIIKLTTHFCFGERYDHYKHLGNIMRHCYDVKKFYFKNQNLKF